MSVLFPKVARHDSRAAELQKTVEEAQKQYEQHLEITRVAKDKLEKAKAESAALRDKAIKAPAADGQDNPLKGADPSTLEWLSTQPVGVVDSFRRHCLQAPAPAEGKGKPAGAAAHYGATVFDEADLVEGGLLVAILTGDGADPDRTKLAEAVSEALAKRGPAAIQSTIAPFSDAKRMGKGGGARFSPYGAPQAGERNV